MQRAGLAVVLVLGGAACGKSKAECQAGAHELATLLGTMDHSVSLYVDPGIHLVSRDDLGLAPPPWAPTIEIRAAETVLNGELMDDPSRFGEKLAGLRAKRADDLLQMSGRPDSPDPRLITVVVDEAATWETVVRVAETAYGAGLDRLAFVFARPPVALTPPPRNWVDKELDAIQTSEEAGNKATRLADLTAKVTRTCPALTRAFGSVTDTGEDKAEYLIRSLEPALVECQCDLDLPALRSILYRLLYVPNPSAALQVTLAPGRAPLALPGSTPWREASKQLTPANVAVWLGVTP